MNRWWIVALILISSVMNQAPAESQSEWRLVHTGRVEAVGGEVDVVPQMAGTIQEVRVIEGQKVTPGEIISVLDAKTEKAQVELAEANFNLAKAKLMKIKAGPGNEEIKESYLQRQSCEAELSMVLWDLSRFKKLRIQNAVSEKELKECEHKAESLQKKVDSLQKRYEATKRGALPEEIAVAKSVVAAAEKELDLARVKYDYRHIRAPFAGTVLRLYRHVGDAVKLENPTPILQLADTGNLRIRAEIDEADVYRIKPGMEGFFSFPGSDRRLGKVVVKDILPLFGPKRLFDPDSSAKVDTRTIQVLCDIQANNYPLYCGQRVTVTFVNDEQLSK